jgi:hypothetical protein
MKLHQIESFCTAKKTIARVKTQLTEWEKVFARYSYDRGLIFRILYKKLKKIKH